MDSDSGRRSYASNGGEQWPESPSELVYDLDAVAELFQRVQAGRPVDLLERLLDCVNWREMFGSEGSGFLQPAQVAELKRYYREKFAGVERYYLAEQLSTELMTALLNSGEWVLSDELKQLGRERPDLWREIRTFFGRKEFSTAALLAADRSFAD